MKYSIQKTRIVLSVCFFLLMFLFVPVARGEDIVLTNEFVGTSLSPRTSALHHKIVDDMIGSTVAKGITSDEGDFCKVADESFVALPLDSRISFAWNSTSYKSQITSPEDESVNKEFFLMVDKTLNDLNPNLDILSAKDENEQFMFTRSRALLRSSLIEMMYEIKNETVDTVRLDNLFDLYNSSLTCVLNYATNNDGNKESYDKIGGANIAFATFWDSKKTELGIEPSTAPTPLSVSVKSGMIQDENTKKVVDPNMVNSRADLESYVYSIINSNSYIKSVNIDENFITVKYSEKVKLLGFIPMYMGTRIVIPDDKVLVNKTPWYRFMVSRKLSGISTDDFAKNLESHISKSDIEIQGIGEELGLSVTTKMTLKDKAHALKSISDTIINAYENDIKTKIPTDNINTEEIPASI